MNLNQGFRHSVLLKFSPMYEWNVYIPYTPRTYFNAYMKYFQSVKYLWKNSALTLNFYHTQNLTVTLSIRYVSPIIITMWHLYYKTCFVRTMMDFCKWIWTLSIMSKHNIKESLFPGFWKYVTIGWWMLKTCHVIFTCSLLSI